MNRDFHYVFVIFRQPLLRNKWYCVTVTGRLIPVAITWLVWFSVTFGRPSFSSSVSSISTIMAEAHQRDVRDDQDHITRTTSLHSFTKCDCVNKFFFFFLIFNNVLVSSTLTLPVNIFTWKKEKLCSPGATTIFVFQWSDDVLVSSTLTLPVNIFTWKKEKLCSPGATTIFVFQWSDDVLVSSTLTLPVNIFTWKKEKPYSPGATKILLLPSENVHLKCKCAAH